MIFNCVFRSQSASLTLTYFEDVKFLLKEGYGFKKINIDTTTNRVNAILEVKESQVQPLKNFLEKKNFTYEFKPSQKEYQPYLISTNLVTKILTNLQRQFFVDVLLRNIEETADIFTKYVKDEDVIFVQISAEDETEQKITMMIKENRLISVVDFLTEKEFEFEILKNKPDWIDCAPEAFDQLFMHRRRTYVEGVVTSKDEKKIGEFIEQFGNLKELKIIKVSAGVNNAKATIRVEHHIWQTVKKYLEEGGFDIVLNYIGEKKC